MVKFSREYEASIIPEWKAAFVDYKCLKKLIKRIKVARRDAGPPPPPPPPPLLAAARALTARYGFSVFDPVRALTARFAAATTAASPVRACAPRLSLASCTCVTGGRVSAVLTDEEDDVYAFGRRARRMMDWSRIRGSSCEPRTSM
jgi:hypothetical protein